MDEPIETIEGKYEGYVTDTHVYHSEPEKNKVEEHNEKYGDKAGKKVTLGMLSSVFKRGIGAYRTNPGSVRPSVTSEEQWAYARVNAFLFAVRTGKFRGGKFDLDLLPSGHPLAT